MGRKGETLNWRTSPRALRLPSFSRPSTVAHNRVRRERRLIPGSSPLMPRVARLTVTGELCPDVYPYPVGYVRARLEDIGLPEDRRAIYVRFPSSSGSLILGNVMRVYSKRTPGATQGQHSFAESFSFIQRQYASYPEALRSM